MGRRCDVFAAVLTAAAAVFALAGVAAAANAGVHPGSLSRTTIHVTGAEARVEHAFQTLSLIEALPELDADEDLELSPAEVEAGRARIATYLGDGLRIRIGPEVLTGELVGLAPLEEPPAGPSFLTWWRADLRYARADGRPLEAFELEHLLFRETNPWHTDLTRVHWRDDPVHELEFVGIVVRQAFEPAHVRRPAVQRDFFLRGVRRAREAPEHLGLIVLVFAGAVRLRTALAAAGILVAAELAAFACAGLGELDLPVRFLTLAAPLALAYVGAENLWSREHRAPWIEAAGFGLLHGLAWHAAFRGAVAGEALVGAAAGGYGLGLVAVLVPAVVVLALVFAGLARWEERSERGPLTVRRTLTFVAVLCGCLRFVIVAGWL